MSDCETRLRQVAAELLSSGQAARVIGYGPGTLPERTRPVFLTKPEETIVLVYNEHCRNNLVSYLMRVKEEGKSAIVCRPNDVRTLVSLIQEQQIEREQVHVITFTAKNADSNGAQDAAKPALFDTLIETEVEFPPAAQVELELFIDKPGDARWEAFKAEMEKCIRCYACRNACPMCYCSECFVERSVPRWVGEGSDVSDTMVFHITRAMHLAGRCGECNACVEACPMNVDLKLINGKINSDLLELFGHRAGVDPEAPAALATFDPNDYNDFIK